MDYDVVEECKAEAQAKECKRVFSVGDEVVVASDDFMVMRGYTNRIIHVGDTGVVLEEHLSDRGFRTAHIKFISGREVHWWLPNYCLEFASYEDDEPEISPEEMQELLFS